MFNSGFFGKNGLQPFIGQIPLGQTVNKLDPNGWGDRVKVRIQGYHPAEGTVVSDDNLDWGLIIKPTSQGSGNKGSCGYAGGETVFGMWTGPNVDPKMIFILGSISRSNSNVERSAAEQQQFLSLGFKLPNIFNSRNPARGWNYKAGVNGTPPGQQTPYSPTQTAFTQGRNLLGGK